MMEENRIRQEPDRGTPDEEMPDGAKDGMTDGEKADGETPDRGYELDLDKHSPTDLDAVIQDAVEAVERAEHAEPGGDAAEPGGDAAEPGGDAAEPGGDGEAGPLDDEPAAGADRLRAEFADLQERLLRTMADFDNFRKRTEREKEALRRQGATDVLRDFLSVSDNLERALESSGGVEDLKHGLRMVLRQFEELLRRHGVEGIESVGQPFDPTLHEAVATQESSEVEVPTVSEEMQKGYLVHDRLLRPAMVWVAMPSAAPPAEEAEGAEEAGELEEADRVVD